MVGVRRYTSTLYTLTAISDNKIVLIALQMLHR